MKKLLLTLTALTVMANADYEVFKSQTQNIGSVVKTEEVFFGEYTNFAKQLSQAGDNALKGALIGGITGGLTSGGINMVVGFLDPFVMSLHADQKYLKVDKFTDSNGKVAFKKVMLIGDKNPSYSDAQIRQMMK